MTIAAHHPRQTSGYVVSAAWFGLAALVANGCGEADDDVEHDHDSGAPIADGRASAADALVDADTAQGECGADFSSPQIALRGTGLLLSSPSMTADELELFYVAQRVDGDLAQGIFRSRRESTSAEFPAGSYVAELEVTCTGTFVTVDVSRDGLRLYYSCFAESALDMPLHVAARSSRDGVFVYVGEIGRLGCCVDLTSDELTAYGSDDVQHRLVLASRTTTSEPFGEAVLVPGFESTELRSATIARDHRLLIANRSPQQLIAATRGSATDSFGAPEDLTFGEFEAIGGSELSQDCRALYFVGVREGSSDVYVARR